MEMLRREVLIRAAALLALAAGSPTTALAQNYPIKPIELVVTTSAGSGGDVVSRAEVLDWFGRLPAVSPT